MSAAPTLERLAPADARRWIVARLRTLDDDVALEEALVADALRAAVVGESDVSCDQRALLGVARAAALRCDLLLGRPPRDPNADTRQRHRLVHHLVDAGDLAADGERRPRYLPTALRAVVLDERIVALIGSTPTNDLLVSSTARVRSAGLLRLADRGALAEVPELELDAWLGSPASARAHAAWLDRCTRTTAPHLREIPPEEPTHWSAYGRGADGHYRFLARGAPVSSGDLILLRHETPETKQQSYWLARCAHDPVALRPRVGVDITLDASRRWRYAVRARAGEPTRVTIVVSRTLVRLQLTATLPDPERKVFLLGSRRPGERFDEVVFRRELVPVLLSVYETLGVQVVEAERGEH